MLWLFTADGSGTLYGRCTLGCFDCFLLLTRRLAVEQLGQRLLQGTARGNSCSSVFAGAIVNVE